MKTINKIFASKFWWLLLLVALFAVNYLASIFHERFDLTKEKRYTLSRASKTLLRNLDDDVQVDVFLKGEFPAGFKKLAISVNEFLQECKEYSHGKLRIKFVDPLKGLDRWTATDLWLDAGLHGAGLPRVARHAEPWQHHWDRVPQGFKEARCLRR